MSDRIAELLDALAESPELCASVREMATGRLPEHVQDAFWLRRASIALFGGASEANAALAQIEIRRHGKPQETIEHKGEVKIPAIQVTFVAPTK